MLCNSLILLAKVISRISASYREDDACLVRWGAAFEQFNERLGLPVEGVALPLKSLA